MIGKKIKTIVTQKKLNSTEFAKMIGKSRQYVNQLYNSKGINTTTLDIIANALNVPISTFFEDEIKATIIKETKEDSRLSHCKESLERLKTEVIDLQRTVIELLKKQSK